jgi:hypothetical protein
MNPIVAPNPARPAASRSLRADSSPSRAPANGPSNSPGSPKNRPTTAPAMPAALAPQYRRRPAAPQESRSGRSSAATIFPATFRHDRFLIRPWTSAAAPLSRRLMALHHIYRERATCAATTKSGSRADAGVRLVRSGWHSSSCCCRGSCGFPRTPRPTSMPYPSAARGSGARPRPSPAPRSASIHASARVTGSTAHIEVTQCFTCSRHRWRALRRTRRSSHQRETRYPHADHLGSVESITDERGNLLARLSVDAFGRRRGTQWTGNPSGSCIARQSGPCVQCFGLSRIDVLRTGGVGPSSGRQPRADATNLDGFLKRA